MSDKEREAIGTVWHTTEKGRDIVSMNDAQYRALLAHIATLTEQHRLVSEECRAWRDWWTTPESIPLGSCPTFAIDAAVAAVDAADALAKGDSHA
jgi:hypothetical protein